MVSILAVDAKVNELVDQNGLGWNVPLKEKAGLICNLPISKYQQADKLIWRATSTGEFSVRSTYYMEKEKTEHMHGEGSTTEESGFSWKSI